MFLIAHQPSYKFSAPPQNPLNLGACTGDCVGLHKNAAPSHSTAAYTELCPRLQLQLSIVPAPELRSNDTSTMSACDRYSWWPQTPHRGPEAQLFIRRTGLVPSILRSPIHFSTQSFFSLFSSWEQKELEVWLSMKMTSSTERNGHC